MNIFYDDNADIEIIKNLKVTIVGYGSQGHAHANNLNDSGVDVTVALREGSSSWAKANQAGLKVKKIDEAIKNADLVMILAPDEFQKGIYEKSIKPNLKKEAVIAFAHGFNIHFKKIVPDDSNSVIMIAPKGPGHTVRSTYLNGGGVPSLIAIYKDSTKSEEPSAKDIALSYAKANGGTRAGVLETTFKEETETDLYGEQISLTGIIPMIINESFKVLLEAGYSPTVSWFVSFYEVKNIADLISKIGINDFYKEVSETAEYGGLRQADKLIDEKFKNEMKSALDFIQTGKFHQNWKNESRTGYPKLKAMRKNLEDSPINEITNKMLKILEQNKSDES